MRQLFYLSRASKDISDADVQQILARSRTSNWRRNITGCLLFSGAHFAQVLEGEDAVVEEASARIAADTRHTDFRVVQDLTVSVRRYPNWSMGFVYSADFADKIEAALKQPNALTDDDVLHLLSGISVDSLMGPL